MSKSQFLMDAVRRKRRTEQTVSGNAGAFAGAPLGAPLRRKFPSEPCPEGEDCDECEECSEARGGGVAESMEVPFDVGDVVLYGKYKNKRGKIISFGKNDKGQPTVELEPDPKGRKANKTLGLFKIWTAEEALADAWERMAKVGPPNEWSGAVAGSMHVEERQVLEKAWRTLTKEQQKQLQWEWETGMDEGAPMRLKKRKPRSGSKHLVKVCPIGMHIEGGRCIRVPRSEAARMRRQKKKWRRSGAGKRSAKRSAMFRRRFESLISEGRALLED